MEIVMGTLTVFALGAVELWAAVPAGLALRLHPLIAGGAAAAGAITAALVVMVLGERVRSWLLLRIHRGSEIGRHGRLYRVWTRYGVIGLGLLAPLLVGAPLGTAMGIALGAPAGRLLVWMSLGIALWSGLLTAAGTLGLAGIEGLMR